MEKSKARIVWIDQLRSIAFLFVIIGHVAIPEEFQSWIYSFHMPMFFLISGLTVNREKILNTPFKQYFVKQVRSLIVPYFWMNFLMFPLWYITFHHFSYTETTVGETLLGIFGGSLQWNMPSNALWFLLTLFLAELLYAAIIKLTKNNTLFILLAVVLCGVIGFLDRGVPQIWHCNIALTAVVLLFIGNIFMTWYRKKGFSEKPVTASRVFTRLGLAALFGAAGYGSHLLNGRISMTANKFGNSVLLFYFTAIAFSAAIMLIVMFLPKLRLITYIGQSTLFYMGIHIPIIRLIQSIFPDVFSEFGWSMALAFFIYFALAPVTLLCSKLIPYACGKPSDGSSRLQLVFRVITVMWSVSIPIFALLGAWGMSVKVIWQDVVLLAVIAAFSLAFTFVCSKYAPIVFNDKKMPANAPSRT